MHYANYAEQRAAEKAAAAEAEANREKFAEVNKAAEVLEVIDRIFTGTTCVRIVRTQAGKMSQYQSGAVWKPLTAQLARHLAQNDPGKAGWLRRHTGLLPTGLVTD